MHDTDTDAGHAPAAAVTGQPLELSRLGPCLGAEVLGVDAGADLDAGTVAAIRAALVEHRVLVFRGQSIDGEQLMAFGRRFGELTVHPFSPNADDAPALITLRNGPENPPALTDVWHSDETFRAEPPMGTMLCAKVVPPLGGDTLFADMATAFECLSDRMQRLVCGLEAVHDIKPFRSLFSDSEEDRARLQHFERLYPPAVHPVVRLHPESGRKTLFVNPQFTIRILDMDERESRSLLDTLFHQASIPELQLRHHWAPGTLVFWDNRAVQHYAVHDYYPHRRVMERVTLGGDRPIGAAPADPASVRRHKPHGGELHGTALGGTAKRQFQRAEGAGEA